MPPVYLTGKLSAAIQAEQYDFLYNSTKLFSFYAVLCYNEHNMHAGARECRSVLCRRK